MADGCSVPRSGVSIAPISFTNADKAMPIKKSLRKCINAHCRSCVYDPEAAGTWLTQVTICSVTSCSLYEVRPTTDSIPASVFEYYGISKAEKACLTLKPTPEDGFSEQTGFVESREEGAV
jgi:hypothetical protein